MTKKRLIEILSQPEIPEDATLVAFNGDSSKMEEVTGILYVGQRIEICTDEP